MQYLLSVNFFQLSLRFPVPHFSPANIVQFIYCFMGDWLPEEGRCERAGNHETELYGVITTGEKGCLVPFLSQSDEAFTLRSDCKDPKEILLICFRLFLAHWLRSLASGNFVLCFLAIPRMLLATGAGIITLAPRLA